MLASCSPAPRPVNDLILPAAAGFRRRVTWAMDGRIIGSTRCRASVCCSAAQWPQQRANSNGSSSSAWSDAAVAAGGTAARTGRERERVGLGQRRRERGRGCAKTAATGPAGRRALRRIGEGPGRRRGLFAFTLGR
jgi:hypothetical protein